ncbi:hypothetical protein RIF29_03474 [Crotalaria pallida]|uniref:J domain-containing protein n=1 Tax=Crotalaria pallida TaxID=3830 RepID=A0AAN9IZZ7_CROPI
MPTSLTLPALPAVSGGFLRRLNSERISSRQIPINASASTAEARPAVVESRRPAASLYEVLRLEKNASPTEIKSAYRSLAKLYHPDAAVQRRPEHNGDCEDFIEIRNAYETLSDPSARAVYDLSLMAALGGRNRRFARSLSMNYSSGFNPTRRWETDQCW